ncbi:MAG: N-acetylmuramoyl-L-alanine amidase [bacterium]
MTKKLALFLFINILFAGRVDICIDPGHGGAHPGAVNHNYGVNGPYEKDFNLEIAWCMQDDLVWALSYTVSMTRFSDEYVSLQNRAKMANGTTENPYSGDCDTCDYFISVHNNGSDYDTTRGTMTLYWKPADEYYANNIHTHMFNFISNLPYAKDLGVRRRGPYVLRNTESPACLTESAYVTHDIATNAQWFQLKENQGSFKNKVAWGIDNGIDDYFEFDRPGWLRIIMVPGSRSTISLDWESCPQNVTGYHVYRRIHPNEVYTQIATNIPNTEYDDNSATGGIIYSYYVKGVRSSGQVGNRSNIVSAQVAPFISDNRNATGANNAVKIIADDNNFHLTWTNNDATWYTRTTDFGASWSVSCPVVYGWQSSIGKASTDRKYLCYIGDLGVPDSAAQETLTYTINYLADSSDIWFDVILYATHDSILGLSFAIDPSDTGWVVFNTYNEEATNELKIGQFYTQVEPESLENITVLDTYIRHGLACVATRQSDRSIWVVYERGNDVMCKWCDNMGNWNTARVAKNASCPCISVSGDEVHFIWEQHFESSNERQIRTFYNNGLGWSRIQTIATLTGRNCYPYMASGAVAVWSDQYQGQWDVFSSKRTEHGGWTTPQNISQTSEDSEYPQVAICQTASDTNLVYVWTEGNEAPYEVRISSSSDKCRVEEKLSSADIVTSNPVRGRLKISYNSTCKEKITVKLYDTAGRLIDTMFDGKVKVGLNEFSYKCDHLSSGVYFVQLGNKEQAITEKVIIQR